jgi:DNA ligase 1
MQRFTKLLLDLREMEESKDQTNALIGYFRELADKEAGWAVWLLTGGRSKRMIESRELIVLVTELTRLPAWLAAECVKATNDECEAASLILDTAGITSREDQLSLATVMGQKVPAAASGDLAATWRALSEPECLLFHRLITGKYRAGSWMKSVTSALAETAGVSKSVMAVRMASISEPTVDGYQALISAPTENDSVAATYPFCTIPTPSGRRAKLESTDEWLAFHAINGIRSQVVKRSGKVLIWTEDDQLVTGAFPELVEAAADLPDGTVLEGVLTADKTADLKALGALRTRLNRGSGVPKESSAYDFMFRAHDILERNGKDLRDSSTSERLGALREILGARGKESAPDLFQTDLFVTSEPSNSSANPLLPEPSLDFVSWEEIEKEVCQSRKLGRLGVLLKRSSAPYEDEEWQFWKPDPLRVSAVLVAVRSGRAEVGYTFAVWKSKDLVSVGSINGPPVAEVDVFVRENTVQRHGPVRELKPELVFELEFDGIENSSRHKSGVVLRMPRILKLRADAETDAAISLAGLKELATREAGSA